MLTIALVLLLPALAWIEAKADLPPLRRVALALALVALVRLLLNGQVLDYVVGQPPILNGRALAYLVAVGSFALTARMARRRPDGRLVAVLEVGSAACTTALAVLEIRQWASLGQPLAPEFSFLEAALDVSAPAILAIVSLWLDRRPGRAALRWGRGVQGALALVGGVGLILGRSHAGRRHGRRRPTGVGCAAAGLRHPCVAGGRGGAGWQIAELRAPRPLVVCLGGWLRVGDARSATLPIRARWR